MKKIACLISLLMTLFGVVWAQDGMEEMFKVPAEMAECDYMVGTWMGEETLFFGGPPMKAKVKLTITKTLNGRFIHEKHEYQEPAMMKMMEGALMLTYDAKMKMWRAWWFDSSASHPMEMKGKGGGKDQVMLTDAIEMEGMPGKYFVRTTWTKISDKEVKFKLETKAADKVSKEFAEKAGFKGEWFTTIDGHFKKS